MNQAGSLASKMSPVGSAALLIVRVTPQMQNSKPMFSPINC